MRSAARYPSHPTAPGITALSTLHPDFDTRLIDIVACGSTMGNLLRFCRSSDRSFRFDVELIGTTAFFVRKENTPKELIPDVRGYGHTFPEAYTTWDREVKGSESHQRLVLYDFGKLKCLVRTESDGYLPAEVKGARKSTASQSSMNVMSLTQAMTTAKVATTTGDSDGKLRVKVQGVPVIQHDVFDLKTRSARGGDIDMAEILPRLWVSQTPNFIIAYHNRGHFEDIQIRDVKKQIEQWESDNQLELTLMNSLISMIIVELKKTPCGKLEVCRDGKGPLELRMQTGRDRAALPEALKAWWLQHGQHTGASDEDKDEDGDMGVALSDSDRASYTGGDSDDGFNFDSESEKDFTGLLYG